ncbi:putative phospholipase A I [Iris pallida]|uniref:Phospholipase A I n=1 Tax=Iris pallida TaxID=29817 RepID=A0AAX6HRJ6_IRIPA|nr:putative phospholipase A I [Iris pallida]KAJ6843177.1 putative phospholipase A I [Iris pallida]
MLGPAASTVIRRVFRPAGGSSWRPRSHFVEYGFALGRDDTVIDNNVMDRQLDPTRVKENDVFVVAEPGELADKFLQCVKVSLLPLMRGHKKKDAYPLSKVLSVSDLVARWPNFQVGDMKIFIKLIFVLEIGASSLDKIRYIMIQLVLRYGRTLWAKWVSS